MSLDREEMTFHGEGDLDLEKWYDKKEGGMNGNGLIH